MEEIKDMKANLVENLYKIASLYVYILQRLTLFEFQ